MDGITAPYGHNGRDGGGDEHVIELLERTVTGQADATSAYDLRIEQLRSSGTSPYSLDDATMAALRAQWTASLFWMMTTSFLDGVILQEESTSGELSKKQYNVIDSLCDSATEATMQAIDVSATAEHKGKVTVKLPFEIPLRSATSGTYNGIWAYCVTVIATVGQLLEQHSTIGIPVRMRELHETMTVAYTKQHQVFTYLVKQWHAAKTKQSKLQSAEQALQIANDVFVIGIKLTAPAAHGGEFVMAQKRKLRPDELDLGFDQWILTDPNLVTAKQNDPTAVQQLAEFWESVSAPQTLLALRQEVDHALATRFVRRRTGRGYASIVPWPSQFLVVKTWTVSGTQFELGDLVSFYPERSSDGKTAVSIRKTGRIKRPFDLLGHY